MENNKNKKSVKFQGDMLNFCDFIQVFVFTRNHHLKKDKKSQVIHPSIQLLLQHNYLFLSFIWHYMANIVRKTFLNGSWKFNFSLGIIIEKSWNFNSYFLW